MSGLSDFWNTALTFGSEADPLRGVNTVPSNAVQSMQPVNADATNWSGFWQDTIKGVLGYVVAKDAQQSGTKAPTQQQYVTQPVPVAQTAASSNGMVLLLGLGLVVVVAMNAGKN